MKIEFLAAIAFVACHSVCVAASPPYYGQPVDAYQPGAQPVAGQTRLRISLSAETEGVERNVHVGQVTACSATACYRLPTKSMVDLSNTMQGKATLIADAWLPAEAIQSIAFDAVAGPAIVDGGVSLSRPLGLDASFPGGEIMLVLSKVEQQGSSKFSPVAAASSLYGPSSEELYFNPRYSLDAKLPMNTELHVPAGATSEPRIFEIAVHDTGDKFPVVDIYPKIKLMKAATLGTRAFPPRPQGADAVVRVGPPAGERPESFTPAAGDKTSQTIDQTGAVSNLKRNAPTGFELNGLSLDSLRTSIA